MSLNTCAVRARVYKQDGTPDEGALVIATLNRFDTDDGYVGPYETIATVDADGAAILNLWPNARGATESFYKVKIEGSDKTLSMTTVVPDLTSADLEVISTLPVYEGMADGAAAVAAVVEQMGQLADDVAAAATSAATATTQATSATNSATSATDSAATATAQAVIATTKASEASVSAGTASTQAGISTAQAVIATTKAAEAIASELAADIDAAAALASQVAAAASQASATSSQNAAALSETNAGTFATTATTQAGIATTQAGIATAQATDASTSAATATTQAGIATTQAGVSTDQAVIATTKAGEAAASAFAADASADAALVSETNADTSEANAASSATAAAGSATSASTSADTATAQAVIATTKASEADASATAAAASKDAAETAEIAAEAAAALVAAALARTIDYFSGDGVTVAFTLSMAPGDESNTDVHIDAAYQHKSEYSISGSTLTFAVAPPAGTNNIEVEIGATSQVIIGVESADNITYTAPGTGAVTQSVAAKLEEFVSAKDFGALGDGSTDDTLAIQAAINKVAIAGGVVHLPVGTYIVSTLELASSLTLAGQGDMSRIKRKAGTGSALIRASGKSAVTVRELCVDGNSAVSSGGVSNIFITGCNDVLIDSVKSIDSRSHGISLQSGTDTTNDTQSEVRNCVIKTTLGYGIEAQDCDRISIDGNRVSKTTAAGIFVYSGTSLAVQNVKITNNTVVESAASGISVPFVNGGTTTTSGVEEVTIAGNNVEGCGENGILAQARFVNVTGNTVTRNGTASGHQGILVNAMSVAVTSNNVTKSSGVGIDFGDCKRVTCVGNLVEESGIIGIEINSTEDFVCSNNVVINNCTTWDAGAMSAGILVHLGTGGYTFAGSSTNGVVSNNVVRTGTHQLYGIKITADSGNIRLIGNDALNSGSTRDYEILTPSGQFVSIGNTANTPTYTPAATVTIPQVGNYFYVNAGATTINSIVTDGATYELGRVIILKFNGIATVGNGTGNIYLASSFTAGNGSILSLVRADAGGWIELCRKV